MVPADDVVHILHTNILQSFSLGFLSLNSLRPYNLAQTTDGPIFLVRHTNLVPRICKNNLGQLGSLSWESNLENGKIIGQQ